MLDMLRRERWWRCRRCRTFMKIIRLCLVKSLWTPLGQILTKVQTPKVILVDQHLQRSKRERAWLSTKMPCKESVLIGPYSITYETTTISSKRWRETTSGMSNLLQNKPLLKWTFHLCLLPWSSIKDTQVAASSVPTTMILQSRDKTHRLKKKSSNTWLITRCSVSWQVSKRNALRKW